MRREQIQKQNRTKQPAAGKHGNSERRTFWRPMNEKAAKEFRLDVIETEVNLRDGAGENENDGEAEANDRETQRRKEFDEAVEHLLVLRRLHKFDEIVLFLGDCSAVTH